MTAMGNIHAKQGRDRRYWPRMNGGMNVAYRVIDEASWPVVSTEWTRSVGPAPDGDGFRVPDPFMEFSVGGLRFDDVESCVPGDYVVVALRVPTAPSVWHVTARVVRVDEIPEREREMPEEDEPLRTHRIAIEFLSVPSKGVDALCAYTEHLQNLEIAITSDLVPAGEVRAT